MHKSMHDQNHLVVSPTEFELGGTFQVYDSQVGLAQVRYAKPPEVQGRAR